jgi:hypothetical protein
MTKTEQIKPLTLIVLGVTGDLARKKLIPAFFDLALRKKLPEVYEIIGFSNEDLNTESFKEFVLKFVPKKDNPEYDEVVKKYLKEKGIEVVKQSKHVLVLTGIYEVKTNVSSYVATIPHTVETTYKGTATTGILEPSVEYTGKATSTYYEYENREFTSKNEYIWAEAMLVQNNKILAKTLERSGRNIVFYDSKPILFKDFYLEQVKSIWK